MDHLRGLTIWRLETDGILPTSTQANSEGEIDTRCKLIRVTSEGGSHAQWTAISGAWQWTTAATGLENAVHGKRCHMLHLQASSNADVSVCDSA
jgi:hypothetical protein